MYKIIAVDDEALALRRFEHIIQKENRVSLEKTFTNPNEVIEYVKENVIDIAFLDIEMPGINGLELAERIQEIDPYISVIFITAFDQYALDAFKAHAIGYLLKPLDIDDFSAQIDIIERSKKPREATSKVVAPIDNSVSKVIVNCIGQFTVFPENDPDTPITFRTAKAAELFALLINKYYSSLPKYAILDALFPDTDDQKCTKLFYVSCSYLRSSFSKFGINDILLRDNDNYRINTSIIKCDYIDLLESEKNIPTYTADQLLSLFNRCSGEYLMGRAYEWAYETKAYVETLSRKVLDALYALYIKDGNITDAMQLLEKSLIYDPFNEDNIQKLMKLYIDNGQNSKAKVIYKKFATKLNEQMGLTPSDKLTSLLKKAR